MIAFLKQILKKSQMNLFGWQPATHEEIHTVHAGTRHLQSGAVIQVQEHHRKVQVRGQEGTGPKQGEKIYYRTPEMNRKKRGHIVSGTHEEGYEIKPVREGYKLNPPHIKGVNRDHIWTAEEHAAENAPQGTGGRVSAEESTRRALTGMGRIGTPESEILQHPAIVGKMTKTLKHLASSNGWNPNYEVSNGVLHNDDPAANELYSEYITAALGALRTSGNNASDEDIQQFKEYLAGTTVESNIAKTIARTGKTAAMRHLIANNHRMEETTTYDTQEEDDYETGMRDIAARAAIVPGAAAAKQAGLAHGISEQLDDLDDPVAAAIIKMKFGLGRFDHGYKEQDIAAALNRSQVPAGENGEEWDAAKVKAKMKASLVRLAQTRGARELLNFLKSLRNGISDRDMLIKSHIKQYTREDGSVVQAHDDKRVKKHQDMLKHQNEHGEEIHSGAKLKHGNELISHLRSRGWKERETSQVKSMNGAIGGKKEDLPEHEEIKAKNRDNGALQTAERAMKKMREAAMSSDDPVSALKNVNTSRSNTYTAAIDDYREKLLNHLGHSVDRNKTATKFEKDGHSIIMSQEGDSHKVYFAGGDPDKAKDAITSLQGKREVQSTDTGKKEPKFVMGDDDKSYTSKMNEVLSKFALVEAGDLTASHTIQGHINKAYPQEIQPRERERLSSQMQMANIMNDIKPELFTGTGMAAHGSPIVGKDGAVESGNGRTIALIEAYKRDLAGNYKEHIAKNAAKYGLNPEDVEKMKNPVLVRVRSDDDKNTDRAEFAREANDTGNLGSSPAEQAWNDSARIDDGLLKKFTVDEDGEIYNEDNLDFINGFLDKLGKNESAGLRDADGDPNKKCIERIQNAVFTKVYGSSMLTELQAESAKPKIRNVLKALNGCVGDFAQIKGHDDLDVVPDMMEAIEYTLAHQGQSRAEMEHTLRNAGSLDFTGDTPKFKTDHSVDMILAINDRSGSRNRLENVFRAISNGIKNEVAERENPEVDMFSGPTAPKTKEQVVKQALDKVTRSDDGVQKSFQRQGLTHLIKSNGGTNGRIERRRKVQEEVGALEKSTCGCGRNGRSRCQEDCNCESQEKTGQVRVSIFQLLKSHVAAYDRTTASGALAHIDDHEDSRVKRYAIKLARTKDRLELHKLRQERFAHLPHWGTLDDYTKQRILDAEDEVHGAHKHWEEWKAEHGSGKGKEKPMAEHLPGDHSGLLQTRLFKSRRILTHLLRKSQISTATGYVSRQVADVNGNLVHRWFRIGSPEAGHTSRHTDNSVTTVLAAFRTVTIPTFPNSSESNIGCNRRIQQLLVMADAGDYDGIANFSTSRTRANYARVDDYKQALLAAANRARNEAPQEHLLGPTPEPVRVTGGNMSNPALISAQIKVNRLFYAAQSNDPVTAILAITTTRSNGYTTAADNYRTSLLRHFGYNTDGTPIAEHTAEGLAPAPVAPVLAPEIATPPPTPRQQRPPRRATAPTNPIPGSANPLNLTEEQLGFVPRPDLPLNYYLGRDGYHDNRNQTGPLHPYPSEQIRDLARRYLNGNQTRAREYQEGTWRPATPQSAAETVRQTRANSATLARAVSRLQDKMERSGFKARNAPGNNITGWVGFDRISNDELVSYTKVMGINSAEGLKLAIGTMLADYGSGITFRVERGSVSGVSAFFSFSGDDGTSINRTFNIDHNGVRYVEHAYFRAGTTGSSCGKGFLRASMGLYKSIGVKKVLVGANCDVGGYAWARFGFIPTSWSSIRSTISSNLNDMVRHGKTVTTRNGRVSTFAQFTLNQAAKIRRRINSDDVESMWAIADMKENGNDLGKALLLGTSWGGKLDMMHTKTMRRFAKYVNS